MELMSLVLEAQNLNHWTAREVPMYFLLVWIVILCSVVLMSIYRSYWMETLWISYVVSMNCSCQFIITLLSIMCTVILPLPLASHPDIERILILWPWSFCLLLQVKIFFMPWGSTFCLPSPFPKTTGHSPHPLPPWSHLSKYCTHVTASYFPDPTKELFYQELFLSFGCTFPMYFHKNIFFLTPSLHSFTIPNIGF